jgi:hypothetical protein
LEAERSQKQTQKTSEGQKTERKETKTRRKSKGRQKEGTRWCLTRALITRSFVFVVKHARPGKFNLSHSAI